MKGQSWYRVELSPAECVENGKADQLQKAFEVMFVSMLQPGGAALFEWFDDRLETNVFYFSPEAAFLLRPLIGHLGGMDVLLLSLPIGLCFCRATNGLRKDWSSALGTGGSAPKAMRLALVALLFGWMWITGLSSGNTLGGFVHLLLVLAIAVGLICFMRQPRVLAMTKLLLETMLRKSKKQSSSWTMRVKGQSLIGKKFPLYSKPLPVNLTGGNR